MRVYKFLKFDHVVKTVVLNRLKISTLNNLNDSFEFDFELVDKNKKYDAASLIKEKNDWKKCMAEKFGFISFSSSYHNPLLWGHYADNGTGICLGFDILDSEINKNKSIF